MIDGDDRVDSVIDGDDRVDSVIDGDDRVDSMIDGDDRVDSVIDGDDRVDSMIDGDDRVDSVIDGDDRVDSVIDGGDRVDSMIDGDDRVDSMIDGDDRVDSVIDGDDRVDSVIDGVEMVDSKIDGDDRVDSLIDWVDMVDSVINGVDMIDSMIDRDDRVDSVIGGVDMVDSVIDGVDRADRVDNPESHGDPVFVTAASSNHFTEVLGLIENMNAVVRRWMPHFTLYIFNLGLNNTELNQYFVSKFAIFQIRNVCRCHILRFPFDRFPDHVRVLFGYTFKPLSIQLIAKDHPFLVWMDTSVRFKSVDPRPMFRSCRHQGVVGVKGSGSIARRTLPNTFAYFNKEPCAFRKLPEIQATFIVLTVDRFVSESIIKPWVGCALTPGCMLPQPDPQPYINCFTHGDVYGECHRFDQSVLGILLYANYGSDIYHEQLSDNGPHFCMKRACSSNGIGIRLPLIQYVRDSILISCYLANVIPMNRIKPSPENGRTPSDSAHPSPRL
ncbi:R1AB-like protein, partial [Mya arenaria]